MKYIENAPGVSYMDKQRLQYEYRDDLKIGNEQPFCFEITKKAVILCILKTHK